MAKRTVVNAPKKAGALAPSRRREMEAPVKKKTGKLERVKKVHSIIEITDMNPSYCTYKNPANMRYVEAIETRDGETVREGLMLLTNDHIARLNAQ